MGKEAVSVADRSKQLPWYQTAQCSDQEPTDLHGHISSPDDTQFMKTVYIPLVDCTRLSPWLPPVPRKQRAGLSLHTNKSNCCKIHTNIVT